MRRFLSYVSAGTLALVLAAIGCGRAPSQSSWNVLLVTLDTTRADRLGCYGNDRIRTPNLDRLASEGTLFENAFTPVPSTLPAHASILTGMHPARHGIHDNGVYVLADNVATLAERLRVHGHATSAFVSAFVLDAQFGLDRGFDHYDDTVSDPLTRSDPTQLPHGLSEGRRRWFVQLGSAFERSAEEVTSAAMRWLESANERPFFLWVHYFDPHQPYAPPSPWDRAYDPDYAGPVDGDMNSYFRLMRERGWTRHDAGARPHVDHMVARYDGELSFVDEWLGRLLEAVRERGSWERTLVVVVGDHGESFGEHIQIWEHNGEIFDEVMRVPLLIRRPDGHGAGRRETSLVRSLDLAPTVLDLLGLPPLEGVDGRSLRLLTENAPRGMPPGEILLEARRGRQVHPAEQSLLGLRTERFKLVMALDPQERVLRRWLYDLAEDPSERRSLASREPDWTADLARRALAREREAAAGGPGATARELDPITIEALRELGYLRE